MRIITSLALLAAVTACEQQQSRLDKVTANKVAQAGASAPGSTTPPGKGKIDRGGTVEQQLARLQDAYDRNAEAMDFLNSVYNQQKAQRAAQERDEAAEDAVFAVDVSGEVQAGQVDGPAGAPITIVKAFDFACPYCQRVAGTMEELVKDYNGKVRVVYANMVVHPPAKPAHLASCAAAKQGKYKEFKNAFWEKGFTPYATSATHDPALLGEGTIMAIAKDLGLDTARLKSDMDGADCKAQVENDMTELAKFHVNSTPSFFINGKHINGAMPKEGFKQVIDQQLKVAEAKGVSGNYYEKEIMANGDKQFRSKMDRKQ